MQLDAPGAEGIAERFASSRVGGRDVRDTRRFAGIAPHADHDPLQEVGHPSGGEQPASIDTRDRGRVAGHDGETQVGSQRLRHRAEMRPACASRLTERVAAPFCDVERMIILEHQNRRMATQDVLELCGPLQSTADP